jgi:hypothetical protein
LTGLHANQVGAMVAIEVGDRKLQSGPDRNGGRLGDVRARRYPCEPDGKKKRR